MSKKKSMDKLSTIEDVTTARKSLSVKIPLLVRLFYEAQGEFVLHCSLTRAMEQFLIARANAAENIAAIAAAIQLEATMSKRTPQQVIESLLIDKGYHAELDPTAVADALVRAWNLNKADL